MKKLSVVLIIFILLIIGCVEVAPVVPTVVPTDIPLFPTYLNTCLPPDEQLTNILPNPCFMGEYPYVYGDASWEIPLTYQPVYIPGVGGASPVTVTKDATGVTFDLTYTTGFRGLQFQQMVNSGQAYLLILRGHSTLRYDSWLDASRNFSSESTLSVGGVITQLSSHSMGVPQLGPYGDLYEVLVGEREFIWPIFSDVSQLVTFEVGVNSIWKLGQHGSTFVATSLSLIPVSWEGSLDELTVIRHATP